MEIRVNGISDNQPIPDTFAFGVYNAEDHMNFGPNRNPEVSWSEVPEGTRSFVVMMFDPDVPSVADDVNQEDKTVSSDLPRVDFFHWLLVDIPAETRLILEAADSDGVIPKGKPPAAGPVGLRGVNTFTHFLAGNPDMAGTYAGYDGPCPPWNDELMHHYHYEVYALDVKSLGLSGEFEGDAVREAMKGHILGSARVTGIYTLNPDLR